jgi:hypothetical protein
VRVHCVVALRCRIAPQRGAMAAERHLDARPRRVRSAVPAGQGRRQVGPGRLRRRQQVRQPGSAGRGGPAADAGIQRYLPGLAADRGKAERQPRDFHVCQLRDWKYSIAIEDLVPHGMQIHGEMCGWALARAYACSGDRIAIASTSPARTCSSRRSPSSPVSTPTRATVTANRLLTPPHRQLPATSAPRMKPGDRHSRGRAGAGHHPSPGRRHAARGGFRGRRYQEGAP